MSGAHKDIESTLAVESMDEEINKLRAENSKLTAVLREIYSSDLTARKLLSIAPHARIEHYRRLSAKRGREIEKKQADIELLRSRLLLALDQIDYTSGACRANEMIGAVLDKGTILALRKALIATGKVELKND